MGILVVRHNDQTHTMSYPQSSCLFLCHFCPQPDHTHSRDNVLYKGDESYVYGQPISSMPVSYTHLDVYKRQTTELPIIKRSIKFNFQFSVNNVVLVVILHT